MKRTELVVFLVIMTIAVVMRLHNLSEVPPGQSADESITGNAAVRTSQTGDYWFFYPEQNGSEGLSVNIQALFVRSFGNTVFALRLVSALFGILTVLGVYLLMRRMFDDWRLAAMAAFLMAVGFWHVMFSRLGVSAVLMPFAAVWGFYYLYKGIETHRLWHWAVAGFWFGLGFHTYIPFRIIPGAIAVTLIAYWISLRAVFSHGKYAHARTLMLGGAAMLVAVMIIVLLPMAPYFYSGRIGHGPHSLHEAAATIASTAGMFFLHGDTDWQHNISGAPVLFWPVAALFAIGLAHTIWRFFHSWRSRGHPGVVQTLLLSWFFVGLIPAVLLTNNSPNALFALLVAPAVYMMAAVGLHWLYLWLERWYDRNGDGRVHMYGHVYVDRGTFIVTLALLAFLVWIGIADTRRYFVDWATNPAVAETFE